VRGEGDAFFWLYKNDIENCLKLFLRAGELEVVIIQSPSLNPDPFRDQMFVEK
jgi:hypothetical protein